MDIISYFRHMKPRVLPLLILFVLLGAACSRQKSATQNLLEEIRLTNQKAPQRVTDGVQFDSMAYDEGQNELVYYYTMDDSLYTPQSISEGKKTFRENLLKEMRASIKLRKYKQRGIAFRYVYWAKSDGSELLNELFTSEDYGLQSNGR